MTSLFSPQSSNQTCESFLSFWQQLQYVFLEHIHKTMTPIGDFYKSQFNLTRFLSPFESVCFFIFIFIFSGVQGTASSLQPTATDRAVREDCVIAHVAAAFKFSSKIVFVCLSDNKGSLELKRTDDYGRSFKTIATKVYSFVLGGKFVFASVMTGTVRMRVCLCVLFTLSLPPS